MASDRLYDLLPAVYRERDAAEGWPLRALMEIIGEQAELVRSDIDGLWDDLFIETCRPWVIPYIGDLVGNDLLFDATRVDEPRTAEELFPDLTGRDLRPAIATRVRTDVARTISYRRRKGTVPMLEQLAGDVTGWPAHAVEFFQLLGWNQHLDHLRAQCQWTDVRSVDRMDRIDGAFDGVMHTVDVRPPGPLDGRHNIRNIGFFLWRLRSYPLRLVPARAAGPAWRFHLSPLGNPAPLFTRWRPGGDESGRSTELTVAGPIRPALFSLDLDGYRLMPPLRPDFSELYGLFDASAAAPAMETCAECSLTVFVDGTPVTLAADPNSPIDQFVAQIVCRRLDPWPAARPAGRVVEVDVEHGRLAVGDGYSANPVVDVNFHYGFSADLGGGPYDRRRWLVRPDLPNWVRKEVQEGGVAPRYARVTDALTDFENDPQRRNWKVSILDSRTYELPVTLTVGPGRHLVIESADRERPLLVTPPAPDRGLEVTGGGELTISGTAVEGWLHLTGDIARLRLLHATLVPGRRLDGQGQPAVKGPSVLAEAGAPGALVNTGLRFQAAFSIMGPLQLPEAAKGAWLLDSIVDGVGGIALSAGGTRAGPPSWLERATILGGSYFKELTLASDCAFADVVDTTRTQAGCVRFSFVPPGSRTPQRYRCQPDHAAELAVQAALDADPGLTPARKKQIGDLIDGWLRLSFTTEAYGLPAYCQLAIGCPAEIRTGAADGSEMGAFCHLRQPQREGNLRIRLQEYLPFGLDPALIYVT